MKVRIGYVSNSSSSSFVIVDGNKTEDEIKIFMKSLVNFYNDPEFTESCYEIRPITDYFLKNLVKNQICKYDRNNIKELVKNGAKLRLTAVSDNTIPLDVIELIANKLDAYYFHLGYDFEAGEEMYGVENEE